MHFGICQLPRASQYFGDFIKWYKKLLKSLPSFILATQSSNSRDGKSISIKSFFCWHAIQLVSLPPSFPLKGNREVYCCFVVSLIYDLSLWLWLAAQVFTCLVKSKPVKQEVSGRVILPHSGVNLIKTFHSRLTTLLLFYTICLIINKRQRGPSRAVLPDWAIY